MDELFEYKIDLMVFSSMCFLLIFAFVIVSSLKLAMPNSLFILFLISSGLGILYSGFVAIDSLFQIIRLNKEKAGGQ